MSGSGFRSETFPYSEPDLGLDPKLSKSRIRIRNNLAGSEKIVSALAVGRSNLQAGSHPLKIPVNSFCRRWTEVFLIKTSGGESGRGREADPTRVAESVARAVGVALSPALTRLKQEGLSPLAVRVTLDQDNVSVHFY
jgi:hypothetical protein